MRRILLILIPVILILALLALFLLRDTGTPGLIEIESDDGRVRLEIPREALVAESDADTIRIVELDPATVPRVNGLGQPLFAYKLEPEGLRFRQPVRLVVDAGYWEARQLPMLLHRTVMEFEALRLDTRVSGDRVQSVTAELQHFSEVLGFLSVLSVRIDDPADQPMHSAFQVNASVGVAPGEIVKFQPAPDGTFWTLQRVDNPVNLSAGSFTAAGTLAPASITDRPAMAAINPAERHVEFENFECTAESSGNRIGYQVRAAYTLLLSSSDNPANVVPAPIEDSLTVQSNPFACLPPAPLPDYFSTVDFPVTNDEWFYAEISKTPGGMVPVGQDFTLKARVGHTYDGSGTPGIANWELKYGRFEFAAIHNGNVISPRRIGDLPAAATIAVEDSWSGEARFRCMNPGSAIIRYHGSVYYPAPAEAGNGLITIAVQAQATVTCMADPNVTGAINALPDSDSLGPFMNTLYGTQSGFQMRWWREPAAERIYIGQSFTIHAELQNLRSPAGAAPWRISGNLTSTEGVLSPASYMEAPASGTLLNPGGTWQRDYQFTCQSVGGTTLAHVFAIESLGDPSSMSVFDTSLECVGD